ncbi:FG-GAP repeat domain-containing protein [Mucilaginibacter koreensis]
MAAFLLPGIIILSNCRQQHHAPITPEEHLAEGKRLAQIYCSSCHRYPEPALADKASWEQGILPAMAKNLGIQNYMGMYFSDTHSTIATSQWQDIVNWYKTQSPDTLTIPKRKEEPLRDWAGFTLKRPSGYDKQSPAMTTMIAIDPSTQQLYTADAGNGLYTWDSQLRPKEINRFASPITGIAFESNHQALLTCIGSMMPADVLNGQVLNVSLTPKAKPEILTDSLPRPVQTVSADFNKDGLADYVTCGFGHDKGGLYLIQQQINHQYKKSIIWPKPGATQSVAGDFNNDGWPDVITLFGQADEGIVLFLNNHKGGFNAQYLLRFPPIYGSSTFQLVDMNHDGKPDIVYAAGDNSDYSKVLKPYHGVYIFINQGNWKFKQQFFYRIDGCTKAIAADFDGDGDMDLATIAFFADFKYNPYEGFMYLEQTGNLKFKAHAIPVEKYGRWITLEAGDINHDGKPDIILGNFSIGQRGLLNQKGFTPEWDMHEPIVVLERK